MGMLGKVALLQPESFKIEKVQINEEDFVYVRQMSGLERDRFEGSLLKEVKGPKGPEYKSSTENFRAKLAVATICDENGVLLLSLSDAEALGKAMTASSLMKIVEVAQKLNKITAEDKDETVKNSEAAQTDNSTSDSVEN